MAVVTSSRVPDISTITTADDAARLASTNPVGMLQAIAQHERERQASGGAPVAGSSGLISAVERTFTETAVAGVYTGSVTVPAGATLLDIQVAGIAVWTNSGTALMDVGDVADPDGWYTQINMKATDLVAGEDIRFSSSGGKEGVYLVQATGFLSPAYSATARVISGVITTTGSTGTAGRTRMLVVYVLPVTAAATKV